MIRMVERKVRERAQQLYEERGQMQGQALADWLQAETEILGGTIVGPLYRRVKSSAELSDRQAEPASCQTLSGIPGEAPRNSEPAYQETL